MFRFCWVETLGPTPALPRLLRVGHKRKHGGGYHHRVGTRGEASASIQFSITGCGAFWPRPGDVRGASGWQPVPPDHVLLLLNDEDDVSYGCPPGANASWEFGFFVVDGPALAIVRALRAAGGPIQPFPADHPTLRPLLLLAPRRGGFTTTVLAAAHSARLALDPLLALHERLDVTRGSRNAALVASAQRLLVDGLAQGMSVKTAAARLGVTREHLARSFRAAGLEPPGLWLRSHRLRLAQTLIAQGGMRLGEIARRCGFASRAQFSRTMHRLLGEPPSRLLGAPQRRLADGARGPTDAEPR